MLGSDGAQAARLGLRRYFLHGAEDVLDPFLFGWSSFLLDHNDFGDLEGSIRLKLLDCQFVQSRKDFLAVTLTNAALLREGLSQAAGARHGRGQRGYLLLTILRA